MRRDTLSSQPLATRDPLAALRAKKKLEVGHPSPSPASTSAPAPSPASSSLSNEVQVSEKGKEEGEKVEKEEGKEEGKEAKSEEAKEKKEENTAAAPSVGGGRGVGFGGRGVGGGAVMGRGAPQRAMSRGGGLGFAGIPADGLAFIFYFNLE